MAYQIRKRSFLPLSHFYYITSCIVSLAGVLGGEGRCCHALFLFFVLGKRVYVFSVYVLVNVQAARRYRIYSEAVDYISCTRRDA